MAKGVPYKRKRDNLLTWPNSDDNNCAVRSANYYWFNGLRSIVGDIVFGCFSFLLEYTTFFTFQSLVSILESETCTVLWLKRSQRLSFALRKIRVIIIISKLINLKTTESNKHDSYSKHNYVNIWSKWFIDVNRNKFQFWL